VKNTYSIYLNNGSLIASINDSKTINNEYNEYLSEINKALAQLSHSSLIIDLKKLVFMTSDQRALITNWLRVNEDFFISKVYAFIFIINSEMVRIIINTILTNSGISVPSHIVKTMEEARSNAIVYS